MFKNQTTIIKKYVNKIFEKDYIKRNISSYVTLILIIKKLDKSLRIYINYKILNILIIRNKNISFSIRKILIKLYIIK